jgi:hypothetical protein
MSLFSAVHNSTLGAVTRHPKTAQAVVGLSYLAAEIVVAAIPFVEACHGSNINLHEVLERYHDNCLLPLASVTMMVGDGTVTKRFGLGHFVIGMGIGIFMGGLAKDGQQAAMLSNIPGVVGCAFGAAYKYLETEFANTKNALVRHTVGNPKGMAGLFLACCTVPLGISGWAAGGSEGHMLVAASMLWLSGNIISFLLPPYAGAQRSTPARFLRNQGFHRKKTKVVEPK